MRREQSLEADAAEATRLNAWLDDAFADGELPQRLRDDMKLCLSEAFCNVVLYAFDGQADPRITVSLEIEPNQATALLSDNGKPFDPLTRPRKPKFETLEDAVPGGFGVQLIRDTASNVVYERIDGWNRLQIVCSQDGPGSSAGKA